MYQANYPSQKLECRLCIPGDLLHLGHLLLILCFSSEKFPLPMRAGGSLFIIHYYNYTFNDQKVAVGGSILASAMATK